MWYHQCFKRGAMRWVHDFQLFLFDFDGLLVNTEEIHYLAYKRMCARRGVYLDWDFNYYCSIAHYSADGLREKIYEQYPQLRESESSWAVLYAEKKQAIVDLLNEGAVYPMPGVEELLIGLEAASIPRCVVTHSPDELISIVRRKNPILNTIPHWITREHYSQPKPNPECYFKAIEMFAKPEDKVIGFEDTPRGLRALLETRAKPVLICQANYPEIPSFLEQGAIHFPSLDAALRAYNLL
jgi:beta-phosphoglucomutase